MEQTVWIITRQGLDRPIIAFNEMEAWGHYNYWAAKGFKITMETGRVTLIASTENVSDLALARLKEALAR